MLKLASIASKNRLNLAKNKQLWSVIVQKNMFSDSPESTAVKEKSKHYDIIIVGGGLVGTTLACSIGKSGWDII